MPMLRFLAWDYRWRVVWCFNYICYTGACMDSKLVDVLLDSSRQLNANVSELTTAVHELTVTTRLQQQSTDALVERMDDLEDWKSKVDRHMTTMTPVTGIVLGVRKSIVLALVASIVGLLGYELTKARDSTPPKTNCSIGAECNH